MALLARGVGVDGVRTPFLEATDLAVHPGEAILVAGPPGAGHTALALALAGRIALGRGEVVLDGDPSPRRRQDAVAIVDTPGISEPDPSLPLRTVVGEELAMARHGARPAQVGAWLQDHDVAEYGRARYEDVPVRQRLQVMTALAILRPKVEVLVLTVPDRHGGPVEQWWHIAETRAADGAAVVVTCTEPSALLLGQPYWRLGRTSPISPTEPDPIQARSSTPDGTSAPETIPPRSPES